MSGDVFSRRRRNASRAEPLAVLPAVTTSTKARRSADKVVVALPVRFESAADLVAGCLEADPRAAAALWEATATVVRRVVARALGPDGDVEDLAQDSMVALWRALPTLRDPDALESFAVGIAVRTTRKALRRRKLWRAFARLTFQAEERTVPPSDDDARQALVAFYDALDAMSVETRLAFILRFVEERELVEVARALDVSLATAKRRLALAEKMMRAAAARDPRLGPWVDESGARERGVDDGGAA